MPQTSFELDPGTAQAVQDLQSALGVTDGTSVIKKAIALARVAARNASAADTVTLLGKDGERLDVLLKS